MNIRKMSLEELELMSYTDIAYFLLKEKTKRTTAELFKEECDILKLPKKAYENKIGIFYTSLTTDKRFILLDSGEWDLKENHSVKTLKIDEMLDEMEEIDMELPTDEEDSDDIDYDENTDDDAEDISEEYKNLVIVDEEELEQDI